MIHWRRELSKKHGDGSLVDVGSGRSLVEGGGFFYDSLVEVGEGGLGVFDSLEARFDLGGSGGRRR